MSERHFAHWPRGLPRGMTIPETDLFYNVEVSARRFPNKPYLVFYDTQISFAEFKDEAERIAGWLQPRSWHGYLARCQVWPVRQCLRPCRR